MPDKELCLTLQQRRAAERVSARLDHAGARPVEIEKRVVTVREIVASERVDERRIDPLGVEYLEQLTNTGQG